MTAYTAVDQIVALQCGECGVWFGMTKWMYDKRVEDRRSFYCTNGHNRVFIGETEAEKQERRARIAEQRLLATRDLLHAEERSHSATRGHLTRTKKRVANGVCPCCNRSFPKLHEHMRTKHPDYVDASAQPAASETPARGNLKTDVERIVREKGPIAPAAIVAELGHSTANAVGVALDRLKRDGLVESRGYGRWVGA